MQIYQVIYEDSDGVVSQQVVTESSEESVYETWENERSGEDAIVDVIEHGTFRTHESFQEVKEQLLNAGVPEKYL